MRSRAEEDVPDDAALRFSDDRDSRFTASNEQRDEASFQVRGKGGTMNGVDGCQVGNDG